MDIVEFYSDGGCRVKNNTKGNKVGKDDVCAYAYRIDVNQSVKAKNGKATTGYTNNQMELSGLLAGLIRMKELELNEKRVVCYLDSKYVLDCINSWLPNWKKNNWKTSQKKPVKNKDFWVKIDNLLKDFTNIQYIWVKGHEDNEGNNDVDKTLNELMDRKEDDLRQYIDETNNISKEAKVKEVRKMTHEDFMKEVPYIIANEEQDMTIELIDPEEVFCVWSCKTLQNSKAIFSMPHKGALLWEATLNGDTGEIYLDGYKKVVHVDLEN